MNHHMNYVIVLRAITNLINRYFVLYQISDFSNQGYRISHVCIDSNVHLANLVMTTAPKSFMSFISMR